MRGDPGADKGSGGADLPLSHRIADYIVGADGLEISAQALDKARDGFIDFLASAIDGISTPSAQAALAYAEKTASGRHGVVGTASRLSAEGAALVSGAIAHTLIRDDTHVASGSHPSVAIWPALMPIAIESGSNGRRLLVAAILAYEVGARLGAAVMTPEIMARFRPTGIIGPIAGAAGCAYLMGLDRGQTASALGFAANMASGFNEWATAAGHEAFFHAGLAARSAVTAVYLAEAGAISSPTALEGRAGFLAAFDALSMQDRILPFPAAPAAILDAYWKPFPACNFVQAPCQAALALPLAGRLAEVRHVTVRCPSAAIAYPGCNNPGPFVNALDAKMSIQFSVASTLVTGHLEEANFARFDDAETLWLAQQIELVADPAMDAVFPGKQPASVSVAFSDGQSLSSDVENVERLSARQMRDRFVRACAGQWSPAFAKSALARLDRLATEDDLSATFDMLMVG